MRKIYKMKKVGIVIEIVIVLLFIVLGTDYLLAQNKKEPLFCKKENIHWDGGSYECFGLGYKINVYKNISGIVEEVEFGTWGMEFNKQNKL